MQRKLTEINGELKPNYIIEEDSLNKLTRGELNNLQWDLAMEYLRLEYDETTYTHSGIHYLSSSFPISHNWESYGYVQQGTRVSPTYKFKFNGEMELTINAKQNTPGDTSINIEFSLDGGETWQNIDNNTTVSLSETETIIYELKIKQTFSYDPNYKTVSPQLNANTINLQLISGQLKNAGELLFKGKVWGQDIDGGEL